MPTVDHNNLLVVTSRLHHKIQKNHNKSRHILSTIHTMNSVILGHILSTIHPMNSVILGEAMYRVQKLGPKFQLQ